MIDLNDFVAGVDLPAAIGRRLKVEAKGKGRIWTRSANSLKKTVTAQFKFQFSLQNYNDGTS